MGKYLALYFIILPLFIGASVTQKLTPTEPKGETPDWLRIKRDCGIPDNEVWCYKTRIKYQKQIKARINYLHQKHYGVHKS